MIKNNLQVRTDPTEWAYSIIFDLFSRYKVNQTPLLCTQIEVRSPDVKGIVSRIETSLNDLVRYDLSDYATLFLSKEEHLPSSLVYATQESFSKVVQVYCYSDEIQHANLVSKINKIKEYPGMLIEWHYSTNHGSSRSMVPLNNNFVIKDEYYPQITGGVKDYYRRYNNASAPVLILLGEPGTGKTSFIRNYIEFSNRKAVVTYDEKVMSSDQFLIDFLTSKDSDLLIIEDADILLSSRNKERNGNMAKFLNISDGIVKMDYKKIIFSTNLKDTREIDSALIRPGRCHDFLHFRPLTFDEARVIDPDIPKQDEYTLADIFNGKNKTQKNKMGFV